MELAFEEAVGLEVVEALNLRLVFSLELFVPPHLDLLASVSLSSSLELLVCHFHLTILLLQTGQHVLCFHILRMSSLECG